ncbi:hypothetical protein LAZ40_20640 [Cereibacter sphaeroides]|uniref:hypothetical protein n=1 Tax=Rhodobacterales TaxID=204455 RepID=UPI000BBE339A|nr:MULTISPECIES: hypothetical protein [Paracoccaceae]MCE6952127.1 hypothetical protein [Cereibacter sphaeroides]MCE6961440.1 hypothetical protein [Cereibacter sphaeroides]MCE6970427.1 hypothetical protein [Cereibacter sphaeroides]MCE6973879.1 hypothetical protein [Cereibacter sphaeroides]
MHRLLPTATVVGLALLFGALVPAHTLDELIPPLILVLPMMAAALVLRAGAPVPERGWERIDPIRRHRFTRRLVERALAYRRAVIILSGSFVVLSAVLAIGTGGLMDGVLSPREEKLVPAAVGALLGLCGACLPDVLRRECAVADVQKRLLDELPVHAAGRPAARVLRLVR